MVLLGNEHTEIEFDNEALKAIREDEHKLNELIGRRNRVIYVTHQKGGKSLRSIGQQFGISKQRVHQIVSEISRQQGEWK